MLIRDFKDLAIENKFFIIGTSLLLIAPIISLLIFFIGLFFKYKNSSLILNFRSLDPSISSLSLLMIFSCLINSIYINKSLVNIWEPTIAWATLFNWLPFFIFFFAFKPFLAKEIDRKLFLLALLIGSSPFMIIIGLGQYFDLFDGGLNLLKGLIIWFPYASNTHTSGDAINPIFSESNYAAIWMVLCWNTSLYLALSKSKFKTKKIIFIALSIGIFITIFLTKSSNAIFTIFFSFPILIYMKRLRLFFTIFAVIGILFIYANLFNSDLFLRELNIVNILASLETRFTIWKSAISFILDKPILGWGPYSFHILFENKEEFYIYHAHNLFLEIAYNFGIPCALVMMNFFLKTLSNVCKKIINSKNFQLKRETSMIDVLWLLTTFMLLFSQLVDFQLYDGRINFCLWILLAGCEQISNKKELTTSDN